MNVLRSQASGRLRRDPIVSCLLVALLVAAQGAGSLAAQSGGRSADIEQYRGKSRVLLVFAPAATDSRYTAFAASLRGQEAGLKERDVVRYDVLETGVSKREGVMLSADEARRLRTAFQAPPRQFRAVLVDKDGSRTWIARRPITAAAVIAQIDSTPLRRYEVRRRGKPAGPVAAGAPGAGDDRRPQPNKRYTPDQVVKIQMEALQHNDVPKPDAGIATTFDFASPQNKQATGPLDHFTLIVKGPSYLPMLNCKKVTYDPVIIDDDHAQQAVHITAANGTRITYIFMLSLQKEGLFAGCWMNDGCVRDDSEADRHRFDA